MDDDDDVEEVTVVEAEWEDADDDDEADVVDNESDDGDDAGPATGSSFRAETAR